MTTTRTRAALELRKATPEEQSIHDLIARMTPQIERALPSQIGADRFTRLILTELRRTPILYDCSPESLLGAMLLSAQLGLEPGPLGHVYLMPFKREVSFILGYRGMIELARRSGQVGLIRAAVVYGGDEFDYYETQTGPKLRHVEAEPVERGEAVCYYGLATFHAGPRSWASVVKRLWPADVEAARKRSPMGRENRGAWQTDFEAMALKTCIRRMAPWLPMTPLMGRALGLDESTVSGVDEDAEPVIEAEADEA